MDRAPAKPLSPCVGVCRLGPDGRCEGCLRTAQEIALWPRLSEEQRRRWMEEELPHRRRGTPWKG
ncbi:MAG: hypothetical protein KatS3mg126_1362 [Lysobacteraceae bacterium]|nr:MAG: hypothetical protein KatS3mg126_1362 [Xanthomonadaceae bacterium]